MLFERILEKNGKISCEGSPGNIDRNIFLCNNIDSNIGLIEMLKKWIFYICYLPQSWIK